MQNSTAQSVPSLRDPPLGKFSVNQYLNSRDSIAGLHSAPSAISPHRRNQPPYRCIPDNCILIRKKVVQQIMTILNLPPDRTSVGGDSHYRCAKCLSHTRSED